MPEVTKITTGAPRARVNGVEYALVYGDGCVWIPQAGGYGPIYVWVSVADPDYVAPKHVSEQCDEYMLAGQEAERLEAAAGWDPNP